MKREWTQTWSVCVTHTITYIHTYIRKVAETKSPGLCLECIQGHAYNTNTNTRAVACIWSSKRAYMYCSCTPAYMKIQTHTNSQASTCMWSTHAYTYCHNAYAQTHTSACTYAYPKQHTNTCMGMFITRIHTRTRLTYMRTGSEQTIWKRRTFSCPLLWAAMASLSRTRASQAWMRMCISRWVSYMCMCSCVGVFWCSQSACISQVHTHISGEHFLNVWRAVRRHGQWPWSRGRHKYMHAYIHTYTPTGYTTIQNV
jgi:hypothetical protein